MQGNAMLEPTNQPAPRPTRRKEWNAATYVFTDPRTYQSRPCVPPTSRALASALSSLWYVLDVHSLSDRFSGFRLCS